MDAENQPECWGHEREKDWSWRPLAMRPGLRPHSVEFQVVVVMRRIFAVLLWGANFSVFSVLKENVELTLKSLRGAA